MNTLYRIALLWGVSFILIPSVCQAFDLYVHSLKAPLFSSPSMGSERVFQVGKGEKLMGVLEKESWYQIQYQEKKAWVFKLMVRKEPPVESETVNKEQLDQLSDKARRRPSAFASTAAARGLVDQRKRFSQGHVLDFDALKKMVSFAPSEADVDLFIKQGEEK